MTPRALLIDLDGTVADTLPVCMAAFRAAFRRHTGATPPDREIERHFGINEEGIFQRMAPGCWQACLATFQREYARAHAACPAAFPGIAEVLQSARRRGVRVGMVTGKNRESAETSLRHLGLAGLLDALRTGSALGNNKREMMAEILGALRVPPAGAVYLGDAPSDIRAARAAGVTALAAAWASTADPAALAAELPDAQFDSVAALSAWLERWWGAAAA